MLDLLLQVLHLLLSVARKAELLLEAPENSRTGFDGGLAEHVMQNDHLKGQFNWVINLARQCLAGFVQDTSTSIDFMSKFFRFVVVYSLEFSG